MKKNAQFFLLAAVIISAVVISLGITANHATVNKEPRSFYDFSYDVKREVGAVLDYEVYSNIKGPGELEDFVSLLAKDIKDKNPDSDFLFLYGNNESLNLRNYGSRDVSVGNNLVDGQGSAVQSIITFGGGGEVVSSTVGDYNKGSNNVSLSDVGDDVVVKVAGHDFKFPLSRHRQVFFIMQKEVGDERFVVAK